MEHASLPNQVCVSREICRNLSGSESREVLITNGIGGYGSLTLANSLTRSYHGLLIAALRPPLDRTLMLSKVNDTVTYMGQSYHLFTDRRIVRDTKNASSSTSRQTTSQPVRETHQTVPESHPPQSEVFHEVQCHQEVVAPEAFRFLDSFHLHGTVPVFRYRLQDALLEKSIWMKRNENTVYITYHLKQASQSVLLHLDALVNCRNHHERTVGNEARFTHSLKLALDNSSVIIRFVKDQVETKLFLSIDSGRAELVNEWITGFVLTEERARGYSERDDHLHAATFRVELSPSQTITFVASTDHELSTLNLDGLKELSLHHLYEERLLQLFHDSTASSLEKPMPLQANSDDKRANKSTSMSPSSKDLEVKNERCMESELGQLLLAADQFIVSRGSGYSVLAGFHWFTDWTRDVASLTEQTMISLPGLTISTGRFDVARSILETYSRHVHNGMLPNRFPDDGSAPADSDYNNVDGTLWFFEAIRSYYDATSDNEFLQDVFPVLQGIIDCHRKGTRFGIEQDEDGLLKAGSKGVALTWMDAVADVVYTQRDGKPVEVAALWYNALKCMSFFASIVGRMEESEAFADMACKTEQSFQEKFWNHQKSYCYDVVDGGQNKNEKDASLRPNQLIAASLHWSPLSLEQCTLILEACSKHLLTPTSVRSLSPSDEKYKGVYQGDVYSRDSSYHQGVGWAWLLGPYLSTKRKVMGNTDDSRTYLKSLLQSHLTEAGVGQVSELFDTEPPYQARGCIAQAWSVAELLRAVLATK